MRECWMKKWWISVQREALPPDDHFGGVGVQLRRAGGAGSGVEPLAPGRGSLCLRGGVVQVEPGLTKLDFSA